MVIKGKGKKLLTSAIENFSAPANRRLVAKNLKKMDRIKKHKNIVAYNPETNQYIHGNMSEIAKQLKSTPSTIKSRVQKGSKQKYKLIKGYTIFSFPNIDQVVNFKNSIVKD